MGTHVKYLTMEFSNFEDLVNNGVKEGSLSAVVLSVTPEHPRSTLGDSLVEPRGMVPEDRDLDRMTFEGEPGGESAPDDDLVVENDKSGVLGSFLIIGIPLAFLCIIMYIVMICINPF